LIGPASARRTPQRREKEYERKCPEYFTCGNWNRRDARFVTGIRDAIVDLELIGDYAYEIVTISASMEHRLPHPVRNQIWDIGSRTRELLSVAVDG
jgi:phosphate uptake regulator